MTIVICSPMHPGLVAGFGLLLAHAAWESHFSGWLRLLRSAHNDKARIEGKHRKGIYRCADERYNSDSGLKPMIWLDNNREKE